MFCLIDKLKFVEKLVVVLFIFKVFVWVLMFNGKVLVFECEVNVKFNIGKVFLK